MLQGAEHEYTYENEGWGEILKESTVVFLEYDSYKQMSVPIFEAALFTAS